MDNHILEQLGLSREDISDEIEMELQSLAEAHNMNVADYLAGRFTEYYRPQKILDER